MRIKVRQISQGVEDISWKNMQHATYDKDEDVEIDSLSEGTPELALKLTTQKDKVNCHAVTDGEDSPPRTPDISLLSKSSQNIQDDPTTSSNLSPDAPTRPRRASDSGEKGLKRKFLERGTSQGPTDEESNHVPEPLKRPRDESDKDDNPRETKRPSPPPSPPKPSPPPKAVCCSWLYC
jgi:Ran-binding protein 3